MRARAREAFGVWRARCAFCVCARRLRRYRVDGGSRTGDRARERDVLTRVTDGGVRVRARERRLTRAGHEIVSQCEADPAARDVLSARFQGVRRARELCEIESLGKDVDVLVIGGMTREYEGSWRESWSKRSCAGALKHALRLAGASRVPWLVIEARGRILEKSPDTNEAPLMHEFALELERLGYKWAHRTVAAAAFGVPDVSARVIIVASRIGDPRDVLLTEDAEPLQIERRTNEDEHTFLFNRHPEQGLRVYADVCEGFHPEGRACVLTAAGGLLPLAIHDAERMQGLPPGWTMTTRPSLHGSQGAELAARWNALAVTYGCVPSSYWIGTRLGDPYSLKYTGEGVPFDSAVPQNWPGAAYNIGHGRVSALCSPFVRTITTLPCLGNFLTTAFFEGGPLVSREAAIECAQAMRKAGWEPPSQLVALETTIGDIKRDPSEEPAVRTPALGSRPTSDHALNTTDALAQGGAGNDNNSFVARTLPLIKTKSGNFIAENGEVKRMSGPELLAGDAKRPRMGTPPTGDPESGGTPGSANRMSFIAGIGLAQRRKNQLVWAKLPGHPFWPGMRVNLEKDFIPDDAHAMSREGEVLIVFFGESSFGWVREDQCLDFQEHYATKSRDPGRNKARFQAALKQANDELQIRETQAERDKLRKRAAQVSTPHKFPVREKRVALAQVKGCTCRACTTAPAAGDAAQRCIRSEVAEKATSGHIGAKLTIQGKGVIGKNILIFWPLDQARYPAKIVNYDSHELRHQVQYVQDGVQEFLSLWKEDVSLAEGETLGGNVPDADHAGADLLLGLMSAT